MNRLSLSAFFLLLVLAAMTAAQIPVEYTGKLGSELVIGTFGKSQVMRQASSEQHDKLLSWVSREDKVFAEPFVLAGKSKTAPWIYLVEPAGGGAKYMFVDVNRDGEIAEKEKFTFSPPAEPVAKTVASIFQSEGEVIVKFQWADTHFKTYPVRFQINKTTEQELKESTRRLFCNFNSFAEGLVDIQGRKTLVRYEVKFAMGGVDPSHGFLGIDGDGDGKIRTDIASLEWASVRTEDVVFRVGKKYVSTKFVDNSDGTVVLIERPAADYKRIELRLGGEVPDFEFSDLDGNSHKLSEFRGKYLLLEFWGTWCGPCVAEIPNMKAAYAKYKSRGFEILGIDFESVGDPSLTKDNSVVRAKVKKFVAEKGMEWPQAEGTDDLVKARFHISSFPTNVLIDPQGKVINLSGIDMPLRGEGLMKTLEKIIPAKKAE